MPKNFTTGYNIFFAAVVCIFWSILVSTASVSLQERQEKNQQFDKQRNILFATGLVDRDAEMTRDEMVQKYHEKIRAYVINRETGEIEKDIDPVSYDQTLATADPKRSIAAPPPNIAKLQRIPNSLLLYHVVNGEKVQAIVLPVEGKGLWSTIYGYLALDADTKTIRGVAFYKHNETPGLGAEIENPAWTSMWKGREAVDDEYKPVFGVKKGGAGSVEEDPHHVDSLSGATLTSVGVANFIQFWLGDEGYGPYLEKFRQGN